MKHIEPLKTKKEKFTDLDELFLEWKKAHIQEENYELTTVIEPLKLNGTEYPGIEKESFVKDGYICKEEYDKAEKKILFILKESNIQANRDFSWDASKRDQTEFYTNYIAFGTHLNRPKQQLKMAQIAHYVFTGKKDFLPDYSECRKSLKKTAYMNINKRGGNNKEVKVKAYMQKYIEYINCQIAILNPDLIVVIGKTIDTTSLNCGDADVIVLNHTADIFHGTYKVDKYVDAFIDIYKQKIIK